MNPTGAVQEGGSLDSLRLERDFGGNVLPGGAARPDLVPLFTVLLGVAAAAALGWYAWCIHLANSGDAYPLTPWLLRVDSACIMTLAPGSFIVDNALHGIIAPDGAYLLRSVVAALFFALLGLWLDMMVRALRRRSWIGLVVILWLGSTLFSAIGANSVRAQIDRTRASLNSEFSALPDTLLQNIRNGHPELSADPVDASRLSPTILEMFAPSGSADRARGADALAAIAELASSAEVMAKYSSWLGDSGQIAAAMPARDDHDAVAQKEQQIDEFSAACDRFGDAARTLRGSEPSGWPAVKASLSALGAWRADVSSPPKPEQAAPAESGTGSGQSAGVYEDKLSSLKLELSPGWTLAGQDEHGCTIQGAFGEAGIRFEAGKFDADSIHTLVHDREAKRAADNHWEVAEATIEASDHTWLAFAHSNSEGPQFTVLVSLEATRAAQIFVRPASKGADPEEFAGQCKALAAAVVWEPQ